MKIWERYFLKEMLKSFLFFISVFYGLYVLIDYSSHSSSFHYHHSQFKIYEIAVYYLCEFTERMNVIIPFGLLLATIRTLTNLNTHHELIALLASGVKMQTLLKPFLWVGFSMVLLLYASTQFWMPTALQRINHIDQKHRSQKNKANLKLAVQSLVLKDKSTVIFQNYDAIEKKLIDVYWISDINNIYRIKYLYPYQENPIGESIDHFQRLPQGELRLKESLDKKSFPEMRFNKKDLFQGMTNPEDESLSDLWKKIPPTKIASEKESQILSVFYYKMIIPWLCLLAVIGPAPFCVRYSRQTPLFFIYACSLFGLVALYLSLNATLVLAKRQISEPALIILLPFLIFSSLLIYRYIKIR